MAVGAVGSDQEIESLRGLPPLAVDVKIVAPISAGISEADLRAAVESRLKIGGVKIAAGLEEIGPVPRLFVFVTAPTANVGLFSVNLSLSQFMKPYRPDAGTVPCSGSSAPTLILNTWQTKYEGIMENGRPVVATREMAESLVDGFAKSFSKANMK